MKTQLTITTHPVVVALAATFLFIESVLLLHGPLLLLDVLLVFSLTLAAYSFPFLIGTPLGGNKFIDRIFFVLAVISAIISLMLSDMLPRMLVLSSCFVLFFLYRYGAIDGFSFRGSPMLKGPVIALCWTIITVYLPVNMYKITIDNFELISVLMLNFCMVLAMSWLCDLADLKNDAEKGLQTMSVLIGSRNTILLVLLVMMVCTAALTFMVPLSSAILKGALVADALTGLAILSVSKLPVSSAKWMVDALMLCKPLALICLLA
ncbi:MAG: hypothetical protein ACKOGP_01790 [Bacteroidota bacterium]